MKHTYPILTAAAALLVAALSCSIQETDTPESVAPAVQTVLRLSLADTRTSLGASVEGARKVYWSDGDRVSVNGIASEALADVESEATTAEFTFGADLQTPYNILYPASIRTSASTVTLPAAQTWKAGTFDDGMFPMAGYSADGSAVTFDYLCAVVRVPLLLAASNPDTDNIRLVTFSGGADEQISGVFNLDYQTRALSGTSTGAGDKKVYVSMNKALNASTPLEVFLVVPARTYASGFSITVLDSQGHTMTKTLSTSTALTAGKLYNLPSCQFVPNGMATGIEISSAEELIAFATGYNKHTISRSDQPGDLLVATLTQNISFNASTSTAFNKTGGIGLKNGINGTEDYYFDGIFNGNGKTISGLTSTVSLFTATNAGTVIKDLTLDNSCSFSFTHPSSVEGDFGAVVGYHRGKVEHVTVNADVALAPVANVASHAALGGIVGRIVVGSVEDCVYAGNISVPAGFTVASGKKLMIGGITAYVSNEDGAVSGSDFNGTICNEGQVLNHEDQNNPYLIIGGIVGYGTGSISDCETTTSASPVASAYSTLSGTIVNKTTVAYHCAVGGIIGENLAKGTVSSCTNAATVATTLFKKDGDNNNGRRLRVGGIAGINRGSITSCSNQAVLTNRSNPFFQYLGGIAGLNFKTISSCTNTANLAISTTGVDTYYSARYAFLGGIIADNESGASVSDVQNAGNLQVSRLENSANCYTYIGGVFGYNTVAVDGGTGKKISNSGQVYQDYTYGTINAEGYNLGGIAGKSTATITNTSNTGAVKYLKDEGDTAASTGSINLGGIVGQATAAVSNSTNSGEVYMDTALDAEGKSTGGSNLGGIIGKGTAGISACANSGYIHYRYRGGNVPVTGIRLGGIAGYLPATETVTVSGCNNNYSKNNEGNIYMQCSTKGVDGAATGCQYTCLYMGGILGYASNVDISNCKNYGFVHGGDGSGNVNIGNTAWTGGIVAYLDGASSISGCTNYGNVYNDQWSNRDNTTVFQNDSPMAGGIAAQVIGASGSVISITGCSVDSGSRVYGRRGQAAGIVAYIKYGSISSSCTVPVNFTGASEYYLGGIAAYADHTSISGCTFTGTSLQSSQLKSGGGIVAMLKDGSSVTGCSSSAATINKNGTAITAYGGIAGSSVSGTSIGSCHYKTGMQICSDDNFTDSHDNVADL